MKVDIDPQELLTKQTDSRGRLNLGTDYANQEVTVLVVDIDD